LRIGEVAAATGVTVRTLRHYDALGLLVPAGRTDAGYRLYADEDVQRLYRILALRRASLSTTSRRPWTAKGTTRAPRSAGTWRSSTGRYG
jgi:MerR family transcriptional regulator, thiopeptide resistance regulator